MKDFDLRKYLAEGKLLKEDLIDKIKKLKDYNKTEDSLKYKKYDITYDKDENLYSVFLKKGSGDSSDMPEFESSNPEKVKKYLAEGKLLKEDISSHKKEAKRFLEKFIDDNKDEFEFIPDLETGYIDAKDNSYNVDELASIFLDIGQDIPRGKYNQKYKGEGGTYVVVAENKLLKEVMDEEMEDYVSAMYDSDVDQEAEEGFQSDVWSKAEYAANAYNESSIFLELIDHLKSVGGKDIVEGNPDIELELLPNEDIRWSANVTHY